MDFKNIIYTKQDGIATIKFNRPRVLNALSTAAWEEIWTALDDIEKDDAMRVAVLTGEGRAFCVGDDIFEHGEISQSLDSMKNFVLRVEANMNRVEQLSKPVIAAVNGMAIGAGCELVLCTDVVVASEKATFGLPEGKIGSIAGVAVFKLPSIVGTKKAKELILTGETIDATEALRIGMINKVVPEDDLETEVTKMAQKIRSLAPVSAQLSKEMINLTGMRLDADRAADLAIRIMSTNDFKEGFESFMNRRPPQFTGR